MNEAGKAMEEAIEGSQTNWKDVLGLVLALFLALCAYSWMAR